jgi:non-heme chloroperoxidase
MLHLGEAGYRCIAHDRRGHGQSSQPWDGNDMDHYADDLAALLESLDLRDVVLVGFSTGGGEVVRYIARHGSSRVRKIVLISSVPPLMARTPANPSGVPMEVFDGLRSQSREDRSQFYRGIASGPFFGFNRAGHTVSKGLIDSFWRQGMMAGHRNAYECIRAFSETDFTDDLSKIDKPVLLIHGSDDQIVPIQLSSHRMLDLIDGAQLAVYEGAPHGLLDTHKHRVNADLEAFIRA